VRAAAAGHAAGVAQVVCSRRSYPFVGSSHLGVNPDHGCCSTCTAYQVVLVVSSPSHFITRPGYLSIMPAGVKRAHLVDARLDGGMLLELYSRDGVGTMISTDFYEGIRRARSRDLEAIAVRLSGEGCSERRGRHAPGHTATWCVHGGKSNCKVGGGRASTAVVTS
jgi:hypothetical protein